MTTTCFYCCSFIRSNNHKIIKYDDCVFCSVMCLTSFLIRNNECEDVNNLNVLNGISEDTLDKLLLPDENYLYQSLYE